MPAWTHDRAKHLLAKNPEMDKSQAFAIATQQAYAAGKVPKDFGTEEGKQEAKAKFDKPKKQYTKTPNPGDLETPKLSEAVVNMLADFEKKANWLSKGVQGIKKVFGNPSSGGSTGAVMAKGMQSPFNQRRFAAQAPSVDPTLAARQAQSANVQRNFGSTGLQVKTSAFVDELSKIALPVGVGGALAGGVLGAGTGAGAGYLDREPGEDASVKKMLGYGAAGAGLGALGGAGIEAAGRGIARALKDKPQVAPAVEDVADAASAGPSPKGRGSEWYQKAHDLVDSGDSEGFARHMGVEPVEDIDGFMGVADDHARRLDKIQADVRKIIDDPDAPLPPEVRERARRIIDSPFPVDELGPDPVDEQKTRDIDAAMGRVRTAVDRLDPRSPLSASSTRGPIGPMPSGGKVEPPKVIDTVGEAVGEEPAPSLQELIERDREMGRNINQKIDAHLDKRQSLADVAEQAQQAAVNDPRVQATRAKARTHEQIFQDYMEGVLERDKEFRRDAEQRLAALLEETKKKK